MNYINKLAEAKRLVNVEGFILYVTNKGRIRKQLSDNEKQLYKIEYKKGTQYVYDKENKKIQPAKDESTGTIGKTTKGKSIPELQGNPDAQVD